MAWDLEQNNKDVNLFGRQKGLNVPLSLGNVPKASNAIRKELRLKG